MTAVVRGDAQMAMMPAISVKAQLPGGKIKMLAVSTAERSPYLPDVPTLKESGIDVEADAWMGLIAPGGTPAAIVDKINKAVVEALHDPAIEAKLATQLMVPVGNSPQQFRAKIDAEIGRWAPVIKAAGIKPIN
jgi:tripartite-type tricarboxylate transporter receptor subunit TctC